jgi:hypothetical protein
MKEITYFYVYQQVTILTPFDSIKCKKHGFYAQITGILRFTFSPGFYQYVFPRFFLLIAS